VSLGLGIVLLIVATIEPLIRKMKDAPVLITSKNCEALVSTATPVDAVVWLPLAVPTAAVHELSVPAAYRKPAYLWFGVFVAKSLPRSKCGQACPSKNDS
jgi:hypothetical protein